MTKSKDFMHLKNYMMATSFCWRLVALLVPVGAYSQSVMTLAGSGTSASINGTGTAASFRNPQGTVVDANGNIYVAEYLDHKIRKITPTGIVTTFAGSGAQGTTNGIGTAASFTRPNGLAIDASRNIYVADEWCHRIRKITPTGVVTTLAGSSSGSANGIGTAAQFNHPSGVAVDNSGNVFVCDRNNHLIRKITSSGVVTTFAGSGSAGNTNGTGAAASFKNPTGIAIDNSGNLYVTDYSNHSIRKITSAGVVTTLAGPVGASGTWGTTNGTGTSARFNYPYHIAIDSYGNLYTTDMGNQKVRKITTAGVVSNYVGGGTVGNVDGVRTAASFNSPRGIAIDADDNLYVGDYSNHLVRKICPFSYGKNITIDHTKVSGSSSHTDFPVLISFTDNDLRTTSNSGHVQNSNGYDIVFKNADGTSLLTHQVEKYDASTGEYIAWVKVPSLSATSNTELTMYYGNPSLITDLSSTMTWNSDYIVNMHMDDNPTGTIGNSSQQTFTASSFGSMTSSDVVTGKIGSGTDFDGSNDGFVMSDNNTLDLNTSDFSFSCWFKSDAIGGVYQTLFNKKGSGGGHNGFGAVYVNPNGAITFYYKGIGGTQGGGVSADGIVSANTWYNLHITCDVANNLVKIYLDGNSVLSAAVDAGTSLANGHHQYFGSFNTASHRFNGVLDEMRIALTDFSSDWITTEYNNQNSPSTFYSIASQLNGSSAALPVELIRFDADPGANHTAKLHWATASEMNNSHFAIERSYDGRNFETVENVAGNGTTKQLIEYNFTDKSLAKSQNDAYYRLKQVDYGGAFAYSDIRAVRFDVLEDRIDIAAYPNPFSDDVTVMVNLSPGDKYNLKITDINGAVVYQENQVFTNGLHQLNLSEWISGLYIIEVASDTASKHIKLVKK